MLMPNNTRYLNVCNTLLLMTSKADEKLDTKLVLILV